MPITDPSGHLVPAGGEGFNRATYLNLSASINDPIMVANATARAQLIADLAAGTPARTPSPARPVFVWRTDAAKGMQLEATENGTDWYAVSPPGLTRFVNASASGSFGSGNILLAPEQTIPARPFGVRDWMLQIQGVINGQIQPQGGMTMQILFDGTIIRSIPWTNAGTTASSYSWDGTAYAYVPASRTTTPVVRVNLVAASPGAVNLGGGWLSVEARVRSDL